MSLDAMRHATGRRRADARPGAASGAIALLAGASVLAGAVCAAEGGHEAMRALLEKWMEAKCLISRERQEWRVGREMLEARIDLVGRETQSLRDQTAQASKDIGEADAKLSELTAQERELKAATAGMTEAAARLEARVQQLLARAPAPIVERVKPLSQRIPAEGAEAKLSLSERFQNVIGILNEVNKFSREVTVASEVRDLADGTSAEVTVLYLGLGQAYFCNLNGGIGGVGRPGETGWVWERDDALAKPVADVIAVYRNERPATYVPLPLEVQ